jgi:molecular chaperone GrpE
MKKDDILDDESEIKDNPEEKGLEAVPLPPLGEEGEALKRECAELKDQILRRRADFENYRRRVERDREQAALETRAQVLAALLPTIDNLERALEAAGAEADPRETPLREGVQLIYRNLLAVLEAQGVTMKDPTGEMFDPNVHQALMHEPVPGAVDGTIAEVFHKAYLLKDRLLRPALVKVAKAEEDRGPRD